MLRVISALLALVLAGSVCPTVSFVPEDPHACCDDARMGSEPPGPAMTCCAPEPRPGSASPKADTSSMVKAAASDPAAVSTVAAAGRGPQATPSFDTHGLSSLSPLLRSCLRRV
jgi:hypothetical protein